MARCKHLNVGITETGEEHITHYFRNGQFDFHNHEPGSILDHIGVKCFDCGFEKTYNHWHVPQWVARYMKVYEGAQEG